MKRILLVALLLAVLTSCGGVTETGNPCSTVSCPTNAPSSEETSAYENTKYGVRVAYDDWGVSGEADSDSATFSGLRFSYYADGGDADDGAAGGGDATITPNASVTMDFSFLEPTPATLLLYLGVQYPDRTFSEYNTAGTVVLSGYVYDDPAAGEDGGDLKEYFFLNGSVLVHVTAEIFSGGEEAVETLLNGISFE